MNDTILQADVEKNLALEKGILEQFDHLVPWQSELSEVDTLFEIKKDFEQKMTRWQAEAQCLSIGIMGQVKAGKSSFLNALLFNGQPILPEAATPKTANLTRIRYGEHYTLRVEYYSPDEWQQITDQAQGGGEHTEAKVARELVAMAAGLGDQIQVCLASGVEVHCADNLDALQGILNQYTGNDGDYTPLVKSTEITLPVEELRGFEVVDTPGMNDPVQSRTQKTRDYMANCDVVFFLSRSSQFLDQSDVDLLATQLPGKGVKRMVLVAGQFDSAILDDGFNRNSLAETEANLKKRLGEIAAKKIEELIGKKQQSGNDAAVELLKALKQPIFASTFAHGFVHWPESEWSKTMKHVHSELVEMAEDEWDDSFAHDDWLRIANFSALTHAYELARQDRQTLLAAQKNSVIPETLAQIDRQYGVITERVEQRIIQLKTQDVASLEQQKAHCERQIGQLSARLSQVLMTTQRQAQGMADELMRDIRKDKDSYSHLTEKTGTTTHTRSYEVSDSTWYKPWTWGDKRTVYSTYSENYQYLNAADAAEQVRQFGDNCARQITERFAALISPEQLKWELKKSLVEALNTRSEQFDPMQFRTTLEQSLTSLHLPRLEIALGDTTALISRNFSGEVQGTSEMAQLRQTLNHALQSIMTQLEHCFDQQFSHVMVQLEQVETDLAERLTVDVQSELSVLQQQVMNKQAELARYDSLLTMIHDLSMETR